MASISGYRVEKQLHASEQAAVYRATRLEDDQPVIIKALNREYPPPRDVAIFRKEFEVLRRLATAATDGVVRPISFHGDGKDVAMVFEYLPGLSLQSHIGDEGLPLREALRLASSLATTLGAVHRAGIVHKDVKPSNVIVEPETGKVWLIDFGISTSLDSVEANSRVLEGSIAYMSPEQTGRMNRPIDYRTDFYSLGATLYEMLTGRLPFTATDPLELVHAHIALRPRSVGSLNSSVPDVVSSLVAKLLAKTAEERYQSAAGLAADLETLRQSLDNGGIPDGFILGTTDIPDRFQIPNKLYGRETEVATLLDGFKRVSEGGSEMLFVSGYSGIGKSALIHEVHKPIVRSRGYFISGKFDQFKRNIPYASVIQAFGDLISQLLTESADRIERWKNLILDALGGIAGVATEVLPDLDLIIGEQTAPPELSGEAAQNRLNRTFLEFVKVFASEEHPLVIFLDDLQWADRPTLNLLRILVTDTDIGHLMVIGCYRDNEVDSSHPLTLTLEAITHQRADTGMAELANVHLEGLAPATLTQLVADCVHTNTELAAPLAGLIQGKTLGNPFFVNQFLRVLHQDELLRFENGRWNYDLAEIEARDITDNVVALMTRKIEELSAPTQAALCLAAAVGNVFELNTLAASAGSSPGVVADDLWEALGEGYIVPLDDGYRLVGIKTNETGAEASLDVAEGQEGFNPRYRFLHDRVQQAAYSLIDEGDRARTHLRIGRAMLDLMDAETLDDQLFNVVDQLEHGIPEVQQGPERAHLASLFARAGDKARLASAHEPALKYFGGAQSLLGETLWTDNYDIGQPVLFQRSGSEYLLGNFDAAEALFDQLVDKSRTDLEKAQVYRLKLSLYQSRGLFLETVDIAYKGLAHLGVHLPEKPSQLTFLRELIKFKLKMRGKTEEDLKNLPECTDPVVVTAIDIMNDFSGPAFFVDINIYLCSVLTMCTLSLEHGNAAESAYCWTLYGMMNGPIMGNVPHGMELGRVGEHVDSMHGKPSLIPKVQLSLGGLVYQWGQHPRLSIPYFERGFQAALESGDPTHAGYCANFMVCMFSVMGEPLDAIEETTSRFWDFARKNQIEVQSEIQVVERQMARTLMGKTRGGGSWDDDNGYDEAEWLGRARGFQSRQPLHNYLIEKQATLYLLGEFEDAVGFGDEAGTMLDVSLGIPIFSNWHLFYGLVNAQLVGKPNHRKALGKLRKMVKQHRKWAKHNEDGFEHKRLLLEAELARVQGEANRAEELYEEAIAQAGAQGFTNHEAIANELAGRHFMNRGRPRLGLMSLREARHSYQRWGASAVVSRLDAEFPDLGFGGNAAVPRLTSATWQRSIRATTAGTRQGTGTTGPGTSMLDLDTILRASQVISGEIVLGKLLEKLMNLVLENAGARRALLVLDRKGSHVIQAEQIAGSDARVLLEQPLTERNDLAHGVINFVTRTEEAVVIDDVAAPSAFSKDPYIAAGKTKSLMCAPIVHGGAVVGLVYLENSLAAGAFTPERLELLRLLSSQVAISIENADHYRRAEQMAAAFSRFVPQQFLNYLGRENILEVSLGDAVQRDMTILFSDIRSFTAMSERMSPSENMAFLNQYLQRVGPVMREQRGFIDKYIGDAVMALFPKTPDDAVRAAIAMHKQVAELNQERREEGVQAIGIGVGLHHGTLMLGTIGEAERMDSTVISDAVNTASRLEGLTKAYGAPILISGPTLEMCADKDAFRHRYLGDVRPRGRASVVSLYEIYEPLPAARAAKRDETKNTMEESVRAYNAKDFKDAHRGFIEVLSIDPDDKAAQAFLARAEAVMGTDGVGTTTHLATLDINLI
ncbi:MAG: AAA family ATPase [Deltaproteobacteria bacterium]|nr:AAA family ATPase [Deltaproteobacteria bacterium]